MDMSAFASLVSANPHGIIVISVVLGALIICGFIGWFHSIRTRRLVIFAILLLIGLIFIVSLWSTMSPKIYL